MDDNAPQARTYTIRLRGQLSDRIVEALGAKRPRESDTTIVIDVADRAELHGVINRIEDFALDLVSIVPLDTDVEMKTSE